MKWYPKGMVGMSIYYRNAVAEDEGDIFTLASTLATSFILNKGDFSTIYLDLLNDIM
jgi:hypothetical protein